MLHSYSGSGAVLSLVISLLFPSSKGLDLLAIYKNDIVCQPAELNGYAYSSLSRKEAKVGNHLYI
jgi:hypothetical protein